MGQNGRENGFTVKQKTSPPPIASPAFLTSAALCQRWSLTSMTLRRWRHAGKLKAHHIGRGIRFALSEIERIEREAAL
jgi:excisionase family DNA binding protein